MLRRLCQEKSRLACGASISVIMIAIEASGQ